MEAIKTLFADKLLGDDREPVAVFSIPGLEGQFGLYAPRLEPWKQLLLLVTLCQVGQVVCAVFVHKFIIPNRGTIGAYLLGWGAIIPLVLWLPFQMLETWDIRNHILKMCVTPLPMVVVFRTIEAVYDTSPPVVEATLANYVIYYTATIHHVWDPKTKLRVKVNSRQFINNLLRVIYYYHWLSLSLSILMHYNFTPFQSPVVLNEFHLNMDIFQPTHIANAYCLAVHTYFHLLVGFEMTNFGENAKGYLTKPTFLNPLWTSTSPTDFWGRKWNLMIHNILKGGAFLPARKFVPTPVAVLWSFLASGLIHDYVWAAVFYHHGHQKDPDTGVCSKCFSPIPLKLTAFFLWNGIVMLLEKPLGKLPLFTWFAKLPLPLLSTLVVLTALPVSHWYTGDWVVGGYFSDFTLALWRIKKL